MANIKSTSIICLIAIASIALCNYDNEPYRILGLTPAASWQEVKKAFKELSLRHHPDRNSHPDTHR